MKFWNGFFQHQPASNYYYYFTILNVRKELRSRILRFISIRFPFFCAAITSQTHSLTITIISYIFAGVYLVFWTRNGRVYRRVIMMNICALRSSAITKKIKLFNILNHLPTFYISHIVDAHNENRKQKSRFKLNYLRVIYISQPEHTTQPEVDVRQLFVGEAGVWLAQNSDRMTANTVLFHAAI